MTRFDLVVDARARRVVLDGRILSLTLSEYEILALLASRPRIAVPFRDLLTAVWGSPWDGDRSALQVHVSRLRLKLGESAQRPRFIRTLRGFGYLFDPGTADGHIRKPDPRGAAGESDGTVPVTLVYDRSLTLVAVSPALRFLGRDPASVLGTTFTPTGLGAAEQMRVIEAAQRAGLPGFDSVVALQHADGGSRLRRVVTVLHFSMRGSFEGLQGTLHLEPDDLV